MLMGKQKSPDYEDYEWFLKQDLSSYQNKWFAILHKKVIDSGDDVGALMLRVKKQHPKEEPFITRVRTELSIL